MRFLRGLLPVLAAVLAVAHAQLPTSPFDPWVASLDFGRWTGITAADLGLRGPVKSVTVHDYVVTPAGTRQRSVLPKLPHETSIEDPVLYFDEQGRLARVGILNRAGNEGIRYDYHYDGTTYTGYSEGSSREEGTVVTISQLDAHHRVLINDQGSNGLFYDLTTLNDEGQPVRIERFQGRYPKDNDVLLATTELTYNSFGQLVQRRIMNMFPHGPTSQTETLTYRAARPGQKPRLMSVEYENPSGVQPRHVPGEAHPPDVFQYTHATETFGYRPDGTLKISVSTRNAILLGVDAYGPQGHLVRGAAYGAPSGSFRGNASFTYDGNQLSVWDIFDEHGTLTRRTTYTNLDAHGNWTTRIAHYVDDTTHTLNEAASNQYVRIITYYP